MTQGAAQDSQRGATQGGQLGGFSGVPYGLAGIGYQQVNPQFGMAGFSYQPALGLPLPPPPPAGPPPQCLQPPPNSITDRLSHVHPVLRRHLEDYHKVFKGSMMFGKILQVASIGWDDLPTLADFVDERGKNMICFNHICGRCTF